MEKNCYLLTEYAFRTEIYQGRGPRVQTVLARSVRKDRGLNILHYEKHSRLMSSLFYGPRIRKDLQA